MSPSEFEKYPVGKYLAMVREAAGMSQSQLAQAVKFSTATLSRIESGEKEATTEEIEAMVGAINTGEAMDLAKFLAERWEFVDRPEFDHPDRDALWEANCALGKLAEMRRDPELKAVFLRQVDLYEDELRRLVAQLSSREQQIAAIGGIGVGKSTALAKMIGLVVAGVEKLDKQIVLETGGGGITLCEVHIVQGPRFGVRIVPRSEDSIRRDVEDFAEYLINATRPEGNDAAAEDEDGDPLSLTKEVVRAIRNMSGLLEKKEKKKDDSGKRSRIDPAKVLAAEYPNAQELAIHILTEMKLLHRNRRDAWFPDGYKGTPAEWLQDMFTKINNCRHPEFTMPQKIEVIVPDPIFGSTELPLRIIDTKGIDRAAERKDLECHFDDPRTLVVLCSRFNDAPEVQLQTLLRRAKEAGVRELARKTLVLILPRPEEALAVKYDDGSRVDDDEEGYDLKREQVLMRLSQQGLPNVPVEFYNAREETNLAIRNRVVELVHAQRSCFAEQISQLSKAVSNLDANRADEQTRLVFEHVMSDLLTWIRSNSVIEISTREVEETLIKAIDGTRYASSIRASVRRLGDWYNLDFYHHLSYGVRLLAVDQIGARIDAFKTIVTNLIDNDDLFPAREFLQGIIGRVDVALDETYRRLQTAGHETFKQTLAQHYEFWGRCEGRWGGGRGYRIAIRDMTDEEIEARCDDARVILASLITEEWEKIVELLVSILDENRGAGAAAA
jgi:transcriptional regulator with XRE-family HTH domain